MKMIKITFVCYGNICRSPLAEFVFRDLIEQKGLLDKFFIDSKATNDEEVGNPVYPQVKRILDRMGIDCSKKRAEKLEQIDYDKSDLFIGMDNQNIRDIKRIFGGDPKNKVKRLMDFANEDKEVADPYWTRDFEECFCDIVRGSKGLYETIKDEI